MGTPSGPIILTICKCVMGHYSEDNDFDIIHCSYLDFFFSFICTRVCVCARVEARMDTHMRVSYANLGRDFKEGTVVLASLGCWSTS